MVKKHRHHMALFAFIILFTGILFSKWIFPSLYAKENLPQVKDDQIEEKWFVSYRQGDRSNMFSDCDATYDLIFFAYTDHSSFVDAYDHNGNFQFALFFEDKQNGVLDIRCTEDLLYVSTKSQSVFVFDRDKEVLKMTYDEARQNGFTDAWFSEVNPNFRLDKEQAYIVDGQGKQVTFFQLAKTVIRKTRIFRFGTYIMIGLLFAIACTIVHHRTGDGSVSRIDPKS